MKENQKSKILCDGDKCTKKHECIRFSNNNKVFRLKSTNCLRLDFDLFKDGIEEVKNEEF